MSSLWKMIRYLRIHIRNNHPEQLLNDTREIKRLLKHRNKKVQSKTHNNT